MALPFALVAPTCASLEALAQWLAGWACIRTLNYAGRRVDGHPEELHAQIPEVCARTRPPASSHGDTDFADLHTAV